MGEVDAQADAQQQMTDEQERFHVEHCLQVQDPDWERWLDRISGNDDGLA